MVKFFKDPVLCFWGAVILGLILTATDVKAAQVTVTAVKAQTEDQKLVLKVDLTGQLKPKVFVLDMKGQKPRVVIDFKGAVGRGLPARLESPSPLASSVRIGLHTKPQPMVRLVIDLAPGGLYLVEQWFRRDINRYVLVLSAK